MLMLELENIVKEYKKGTKAVDGLSLSLRPGEIFGFLGPNGAGKSTTIKLMVNILNPTSGDIKYDGKSIYGDLTSYKQHIAYVPDEPAFYQNLSGYQYLNFIADIFRLPLGVRKERIEKYASLFNIEEALNEKVDQYSHGMRQKLALSAALIHEPDIFILDEPMVGLDPKGAKEVKDLMRARADAGAIVFFSTHVLEVAQSVCDRVGIINRGRLVREGEVSTLLGENTTLEEFFLSVTKE